MLPKNVYRCPCLMKFVDEMENLLINDIDRWNFMFFKRNQKKDVLSKVNCVKLRNQYDFMILC